MHRLVTLVALCALGAAVLALPASAASEKSQVVKYAKTKTAKIISGGPTGIGLTAKDVKATCSDKGAYWKCKVNGNDGQCTGSLRIYGSGGKYTAPKKYWKIGCVADKAIAAGQQTSGTTEKKFVTSYAKRVFERKVEKGGTIKLNHPVSGSCKTSDKLSYWKCKTSASWAQGLCEGSMRVYDAAGTAHARNLKFACSE